MSGISSLTSTERRFPVQHSTKIPFDTKAFEYGEDEFSIGYFMFTIRITCVLCSWQILLRKTAAHAGDFKPRYLITNWLKMPCSRGIKTTGLKSTSCDADRISTACISIKIQPDLQARYGRSEKRYEEMKESTLVPAVQIPSYLLSDHR